MREQVRAVGIDSRIHTQERETAKLCRVQNANKCVGKVESDRDLQTAGSLIRREQGLHSASQEREAGGTGAVGRGYVGGCGDAETVEVDQA